MISKNFVILALLVSVALIIPSVFSQSLGNLPISNLLEKPRVADIIALVTVIAIAFGTLIYLGFTLTLEKNYRFIRVGFGFKEFIPFCGSLILLGIASMVLYLIYKQTYISLAPLIYALLLILIGHVLGKKSQPIKKEKVTLKMIVHETSGNTRLKIIHNLELYQETDKDYRFKATNGNEFIIPIGQVQEIVKP